MSQKDADRICFTAWLLNEVARAWGVSTPQVYRILQRGNVVNGYILPFYDQLHTMGSAALVGEMTELATKRGLMA